MKEMYNLELAERMVAYIEEKGINTTEVGDCLNKTGALFGTLPLTRGHFCVGIVHYVYAHSNSNWSIHEQLVDVPKNRVIFADAIDVKNRALFGELVTMYIIEKLESKAIVVRGLMRDAAELIDGKWPVWCNGITPEGCFNIKREETPEIQLIAKKNKEFYDGSIAVCDDCGVVIIPKEQITEEFMRKLEAIEEQEKMWFHCVRDLNWSTYDTVCLKRYLDEQYFQKFEKK